MHSDSPVAAYVAPDRRPQAASGLRIVFWAYLASIAVTLVFIGVYSLGSTLISSTSASTYETYFFVVGTVQTFVHLAIAAVMAFGFSRVGTAIEGMPRVLVLAAAGTVGFRAVLSLGSLAMRVADLQAAWLSTALSWVFTAFALISSAIVIAALVAAARALRVPPPLAALVPAAMCVVGGLVLDGLNLYWMDKPYDERPGIWIYHLQSAVDLFGIAMMAAAVAWVRGGIVRHVRSDGSSSHTDRTPDLAWTLSASGVSLIRGGLIGRIVVVLIAVPIVLLAAASRDAEIIGVAIGFAGLALLVVAVIGLVGQVIYTRRLPAEANAGEMAQVSLAFVGLGFLFDLWTLFLAVRVISGRYAHLRAFEEQSGWSTGGSLLAGMIALGTLLASFAQAARFLGAPELAERARVTGAMLCGSGAAIAILRIMLAIEPDAAPVLVAAPVAGLIGIIGFFKYLGLLGELARTMQAGEPSPVGGSSPSVATPVS